MPTRKALWRTADQFNYGAPAKTNVEVIGAGDPAYLALVEKATNIDNVSFTNPADYSYDPTKIEVTGGVGKLKSTVLNEKNWPFINPADYTYDGAKIEVTGGKAKLKGTPINPYLWYHLNEAAGATVTDSSSHGRNGTTINAPSWVAGKLNNCLQFNGTTQYVNCGNVAGFEYNLPFSLECWVKSITATGVIMSKLDTGALRGWQLIFSSGKVTMFLYTSGTNYIRKESNATYNDGNWHHIVMTYSGNSLASGVNIYVDGSLVAMTVTQDNLNATIVNAFQFQLATRNATFCLGGNLDEVAVYDTGLTGPQVTERYNSGSGTELPLGSYPITNPTIVVNTGMAFTSVLNLFTETATKPATTEIKYHISIDDGVTWQYWTGAVWAVTDGSYTQANIASDINTNLSTLGGFGTLKFRALLHSTYGDLTPELDNVYLAEGVTYPTGNHELMMITDIDPVQVVAWLTFVETAVKPANTNILYKYSIDSGGAYSSIWLTAAQMQAAIIAISTPDKIRFKIQLSTIDNKVTPEVDNILITSRQGYYDDGVYESTSYVPSSSTANGVFVEKIDFEIITPAGTSVKIEARMVNHNLEEGYAEYLNGDDVDMCGSLIQWKATLETLNPAVTPRVNHVEIEFHTLIGIMRIMDDAIDTVRKVETNRWKISANNKMIIYDDDGTTPLITFNLKDLAGSPSYKKVFERVPE